MATSDLLERGKVYEVHHARKGNFALKVESDDGEWVSGVIVEGHADHLVNDDRAPGDKIEVRKSFCRFTERR